MAGDICLYDIANQEKIIVDGESYSTELFPSEEYTPIGVVVVPGTHNVYGTGECAIISLAEMSYETPDNGSMSSYRFFCWGYDENIESLTNYYHGSYIGTGSTLYNYVQGSWSEVYLPSDIFSAVQCLHDTDTYYQSSSSSRHQAPSPYLTNDSRNYMYYSVSSDSNALSDFDGVGNTNTIINLATGQTDWKTATTITENATEGYYPVACCCWRYHTVDANESNTTNQGDWYLPACGELGYIMPKFNTINDAIEKVSGFLLDSSYASGYWSSTESSSTSVHYVRTDIGLVKGTLKASRTCSARAFLRVGG